MVDVARWLTGRVLAGFEAVGRKSVAVFEEVGYLFSLLLESLYWAVVGRWLQQPVRLAPIFAAAMAVGVTAIPIIALASFAVGTMLAIQGIYSLRAYGAESRVVLAIAISVTREFAPLITGIFVAGRSASAIAAQIGTMQVAQEIDALSVIGINPVRYLVSPLLLAMLMTMPALVVMSNFVALSGGALYCNLELGMPFSAYVDSTLDALKPADVLAGPVEELRLRHDHHAGGRDQRLHGQGGRGRSWQGDHPGGGREHCQHYPGGHDIQLFPEPLRRPLPIAPRE